MTDSVYTRGLRVVFDGTGEWYAVHDGGGHATIRWNGEAWDTYEPGGDLVDDEALSGRATALEVIRAILGDPQEPSCDEAHLLTHCAAMVWLSDDYCQMRDYPQATQALLALGLFEAVEMGRRTVYQLTALGQAKAAMLAAVG